MKSRIVGLAVLAAMLTVSTAHASIWVELGDAGELLPSAQATTGAGSLTQITGTLSGYDDIDLFKIEITDTNAFSITTSASLSQDNDGQLFVFDSAGSLVADDDDGGGGLLPQINPGALSGEAPGLFYVAFDLWNTDPIGDPLSGWNSNPGPQQTGPYTLTFTNASYASAVPEPGTLVIWSVIGALAMAVGWYRRRSI